MKKDLKELVNLYTSEANKNSWYWEINEKKRLTETEVEQSFKETAVTIIEHYCDSHNNNIENAKEFSKILNTELSNKFEKQYGLKPKTEIDENFVEEARSEYIISQYPTPEMENKLWEHYEKTGEFIQYDEMDKEHYEKTGEIIKKEEALKENQKEDFSDKENTMEQNQKNEELAIYSFRDEFGGYDDEREQYFGTEFYFENYDEFKAEQEKRRITDDVTYKETDLIVIKNITAKRHDYYEDTNTDYNISDNFEKKVDAHLIYHICDKFYTDDNDRQFFKQNKIAYDDNGFIQKIQAVGDDNWVDIKDFKNVEELEKYFSEIKNAKKIDTTQQEKKDEQEPIEKANLELIKIDITDENGNKITTDINGNLLPTMEIDRQKLSEVLFKEIQPKLGELNKLEKYEAEATMTSVTDLIEMKKLLTNDEFSKNDSRFKDFTKKVDEELIQHICDKYYSGYENCEKDQKFFKENKVAYDDNGFIKGVQAIGDNGWLDILTEKNIDGLDTLFKNEYFAKKHNLYELCDLLDDGLGTCERRAGFFSKDEIKDFIAKDETGVATRAYEYKIYNSDGDVTEALKNEVRNELLNQSPEKLVKNDEFSFMIKVSPIEEGFDKEIKKFCDEHNLFGKVWQGDEAKHFTRFMSETIDKQVWENAISQNKIPTSKVKLEVNFNSGESVNIDVPLGKRLFENADIQKLISVSQKELSVNQISDETARNWNELMQKNEKGEYVTKVNNHTIENMFNGGMEGLVKSAQSIGDEHLTAFVQGFASAYGFSKVAPTQEKVFDKNAEKQPNLAQTVANQSKENSQEKQSKKSSEITQDEMNAIKEETNKVGNEVLNKGKKPKDKNISKPTDISM